MHREVKKFFTNKYVLEILKAAVLVVALMVGFMFWMDYYTSREAKRS